MEKKPIDRVEEIIHDKRLPVSVFESSCGLSNSTIRIAISRRTNLKDETLNSILNTFPEIDARWLLTGKGQMYVSNMLVSEDSHIVAESSSIYHKTPQVVTVDSQNRDNITLVPVKAKAGYFKGFDKPSYIEKLPTYRMPGLNNGVFRMFEVEGNSMFPTLPSKSFVVGQFVENWVSDIKDNNLYVIISNKVEDGLVKRCLNRIEKYNNLILKSDNRRDYPTQNLDPEDIFEVWEVKLHLNFTLPDPADMYDRLSDIEAELSTMKKLLKK